MLSVALASISVIELNQRALWNRVPFGKFNRASAFPEADCGVSERTHKMANSLKWNPPAADCRELQ
jgi:hypothetical protein